MVQRENFTSSRLHSLQTAAEKFVNATPRERFDKFLSSLFQMSKGQEGSEATRIEERVEMKREGKGKRKKKCKTLALARDRFSSLLLSCVFLRNPEEARARRRVSARRERGRMASVSPPFHLSLFPPAIHLNFSSSFLCPISPRLPAMSRPLSFSPSVPLPFAE